MNNKLKWYIYKRNTTGVLAGKYIIFYSGIGSSNTEQIKNIVADYIFKWDTDLGVDYGGFGESGKKYLAKK